MENIDSGFAELETSGALKAASEGIDADSYKEMCKLMENAKKDPNNPRPDDPG